MSEDVRDRVTAILRGDAPALLLAPMATLTHAGFRALVDEFGGCDLLFSEMISAEALVGGTPYERYYRSEHPVPSRLVFQLVGHAEAPIVRAAGTLAAGEAAGVDINMGCSAPQIVRKGGGVAWMADVERAARLVERVRAAVGGKSLSVKLRLGRSDDPRSLVRFCRAIESAGADFITLHPKRRDEGSARRARWSFVKVLRDELSIPVVGNGGIVDFASLRSRLDQAGGGPVMIGRSAARSPWIFSYLRRRLAGTASELTLDLRSVGLRFLELLEAHQPADFLHSRARRFLPYLLSNVQFGHSIAARVAQCDSYARAQELFTGYFDDHPEAAVHTERA